MSDDAADRASCNRRQFLREILGAGTLLAAGCAKRQRTELRAGFLPNLTHAVPMVAEAHGSLAKAAGRKVEMVPFGAGPALIEALFAGDLDAGWCGPNPAINAFIRSSGRVRILAAAAYGGAALVVRDELAVYGPKDLKRARLASPQIGNTQDIALRQWLADNDLVSSDRGGTVQVMPLANPDILSMFRSGEIDGAWVVEPWVSRLVAEGKGRVFLEESELHPNGVYPTTLAVVSGDLLREHPADVEALMRVNAEEVAWVKRNPADARTLVNEALEKHTGKKLKKELIESAWTRLAFGTDPVERELRDSARAARRLGFLPSSDITGIVVAPAEWNT